MLLLLSRQQHRWNCPRFFGVGSYLAFCIAFQQIGRGSWRHWNEFIKPVVAEGKKFQDILIPTMDTIRYSYMMDFFIKHERYVSRANLIQMWTNLISYKSELKSLNCKDWKCSKIAMALQLWFSLIYTYIYYFFQQWISFDSVICYREEIS